MTLRRSLPEVDRLAYDEPVVWRDERTGWMHSGYFVEYRQEGRVALVATIPSQRYEVLARDVWRRARPAGWRAV